jgi:hypothetical protein
MDTISPLKGKSQSTLLSDGFRNVLKFLLQKKNGGVFWVWFM